jgi:creatinine amidohydrolase
LVQNATSEEIKVLAPDGTLGGAYQRSDEDMRVYWDAGVAEVRELLTDGWL